jgi:hypothetical protein
MDSKYTVVQSSDTHNFYWVSIVLIIIIIASADRPTSQKTKKQKQKQKQTVPRADIYLFILFVVSEN